MASLRSFASITRKLAVTSLVSMNGPSTTEGLPPRARMLVTSLSKAAGNFDSPRGDVAALTAAHRFHGDVSAKLPERIRSGLHSRLSERWVATYLPTRHVR